MPKPILAFTLALVACSSEASAPASSLVSSAFTFIHPVLPTAAPSGSHLWGDDLSNLGLSGGEYRKPKPPPRLKTGKVTVEGRLPPEVVTRIIRQNYGRFRLCYESALKKKSDLGGEIVLEFTITTEGSVSSPKSDGSKLDSPEMIACVASSIPKLSFPQPEGGVAKVRYVLELVPPPPPLKIHGHEIPEVTVSDIAEAMSGLGYADVSVKLVGKAATPMLVVGTKGDLTATLTFVPATRTATDPSVTNDEERRLTDVGAVYTEEEFFLGVEIPDKKSDAAALLDALLGRKRP